MTAPGLSEPFAADVEQALAALPTSSRRTSALALHPIRTLVVTAVVLALLVPLGILAVTTATHRGAPADGSIPIRTRGASVIIGALPARQSLILHGTAPLVHDPAVDEDSRTLAKQEGKNPDDVVRDYAAQQYLDKVEPVCREAHVPCDVAVFHPGVHGASEVRFATRPPQSLLDRLAAIYPRDLEIEWGGQLLPEDERNHLSSVVTAILRGLPGTESASAGFPASGELDVEYDGSEPPRAVAEAILADAEFRATFVDGRPATEVVITRGEDTSGQTVPSPNTTPAVTELASCAADQVRPFDCSSYEIKRPGDNSLSFEAWFDVLNGTPRFIVGESEHLYALPVRLTSAGATAAPVAGWPPQQHPCSEDSDCGLDATVERIFTGGARISVDGGAIRISSGSTVLTGTTDHRPHLYAQPTEQVAGGHTLLTYHQSKDGAEADAADGGRLTINAAGCLTDGQDVLVLPDTTVLHPDGSIDIGGTRVPVGGRLKLGGGEGAVPADQRCGTGGYWYGYGG